MLKTVGEVFHVCAESALVIPKDILVIYRRLVSPPSEPELAAHERLKALTAKLVSLSGNDLERSREAIDYVQTFSFRLTEIARLAERAEGSATALQAYMRLAPWRSKALSTAAFELFKLREALRDSWPTKSVLLNEVRGQLRNGCEAAGDRAISAVASSQDKEFRKYLKSDGVQLTASLKHSGLILRTVHDVVLISGETTGNMQR